LKTYVVCTTALLQANQVAAPSEYAVLPSLSLSSAAGQQQQQEEVPDHLAFPIASFSLCRDLLRCAASSCPSLFLGRTLDLLSGAETVLAVYERIEGATLSVSISASATASAAAVVLSATTSTAGAAAAAAASEGPAETYGGVAGAILSDGVFSRYVTRHVAVFPFPFFFSVYALQQQTHWQKEEGVYLVVCFWLFCFY
jgi:hypothetical protein